MTGILNRQFPVDLHYLLDNVKLLLKSNPEPRPVDIHQNRFSGSDSGIVRYKQGLPTVARH